MVAVFTRTLPEYLIGERLHMVGVRNGVDAIQLFHNYPHVLRQLWLVCGTNTPLYNTSTTIHIYFRQCHTIYNTFTTITQYTIITQYTTLAQLSHNIQYFHNYHTIYNTSTTAAQYTTITQNTTLPQLSKTTSSVPHNLLHTFIHFTHQVRRQHQIAQTIYINALSAGQPFQ